MAIIDLTHQESQNIISDYSAFEHLWRSIIPVSTPNRKDSLMLMLTAYFDESGTHDGSTVVTVAGYLAKVKQWERFELEWVALLKEFEIPYSHATDMAQFKKHFSSWKVLDENGCLDDTKRIAFTQKAHHIIKKNVIKSFEASLFREDFDAEIGNWKGNIPIQPYFLLVNAVMLRVGKWLVSEKVYVPIHYVFEHKDGVEGVVGGLYQEARNDLRSALMCLGSVSFAEGKRNIKGVPPVYQLQAADLNAYEVNKVLSDKVSGRLAQIGEVRKSLKSLRENEPTMFILPRKAVCEIIENMNKELENEYEKRS